MSGILDRVVAGGRGTVLMLSSNGNIFRATGHLCREFIGHRWILRTKASDAELWCFIWSAPEYKRLSKQSWGWWFETPSHPLWRHCNGFEIICESLVVFLYESVFRGILTTSSHPNVVSTWFFSSWKTRKASVKSGKIGVIFYLLRRHMI